MQRLLKLQREGFWLGSARRKVIWLALAVAVVSSLYTTLLLLVLVPRSLQVILIPLLCSTITLTCLILNITTLPLLFSTLLPLPLIIPTRPPLPQTTLQHYLYPIRLPLTDTLSIPLPSYINLAFINLAGTVL